MTNTSAVHHIGLYIDCYTLPFNYNSSILSTLVVHRSLHTPLHQSCIILADFDQNGWRGLEHEEVLASAPDEESGAGVA